MQHSHLTFGGSDLDGIDGVDANAGTYIFLFRNTSTYIFKLTRKLATNFVRTYSAKDGMQYFMVTDVWSWSHTSVTQSHSEVLQRILSGQVRDHIIDRSLGGGALAKETRVCRLHDEPASLLQIRQT